MDETTNTTSSRRISRRGFVQALATSGGVAGMGCLGDWHDEPSDRTGQIRTESITGIVVDDSGEPIADATLEFLREGSNMATELTTNGRGHFESEFARPMWARVSHPAYTTRIRAVEPGSEHRFRLSADTVSLSFAGDVMFARRFYEENHDPTAPRFRIDENDRLNDHREILRYVSPLLETADITSVNLETPLTTTDWRHPTKTYTLPSHPVAAEALADAGVDYAALGNNHTFDALSTGLEETVDTLDEVDIDCSGAGSSSDEAWQPAYVERDGVTVALLSCTPIVGLSNELHWSADRPREDHTVRQGGQTRTVPGEAGVAEPTPDRLYDRVERANSDADVVVVQIHGGEAYRRESGKRIEQLSDAAADAGADLVVNHHPHVTGGLEYRGETLVAWTLGNFVFDQEFWETLRSYVLNVEIDANGVERVSIEPILLEGYIPKGVTGEPRREIIRETAGLSSDEFAVLDDVLEDPAQLPDRSVAPDDPFVIESEGAIHERVSGALDEIVSHTGTVRVGRDRLLTGEFKDPIVDNQRYEGALWRYGRGSTPTTGAGLGFDGSGGARLSRRADNEDRAFLSPRHRLRVHEEQYTLTTRYRSNADEYAEILVSWYDDRSGNSFTSTAQGLPDTDGDWTRFTLDLQAPANASHVDVFAFLEPPEDGGTREVAFDGIRLIEWTNRPRGGEEYDHLYVDGRLTAEFSVAELDDDIEHVHWPALD